MINENFLRLNASYLFAEISRRIKEYEASHPNARLIRMGIGDVTRPLPPSVITAMHKAVEEFTSSTTLQGYGPEQGYAFLREAIVEHDYQKIGVSLDPSEVFVSDGAKSDTANITDLFSKDVRVAITDPVYPVYLDSNIIGGRREFTYLPCNKENGFIPELPKGQVDLIYLCFPNNPTGTTLTKGELTSWVEYARENGSIILFDSAYEAYVTESDVPRSIYEIAGAKECAIEFRSYSKTAGFTGIRCGYTVVPHDLRVKTKSGDSVELNALWNRRQTTKFNGASYISQRAAHAIYTPEGADEVRQNIQYYMQNARLIRNSFEQAGYDVVGGINSPYIWVKTPESISGSWDFFNYLLHEKEVIGTPGVGFGSQGEGYFRLTGFNTHDATKEAMQRILNS